MDAIAARRGGVGGQCGTRAPGAAVAASVGVGLKLARPSSVDSLEDRLQALRRQYAQSLPQKTDDLARAWTCFRAAPADRVAATALHACVHRLSGSAPAYGFDAVGAAAQPADALLSGWINAPADDAAAAALCQALAPHIETLLATLRAV